MLRAVPRCGVDVGRMESADEDKFQGPSLGVYSGHHGLRLLFHRQIYEAHSGIGTKSPGTIHLCPLGTHRDYWISVRRAGIWSVGRQPAGKTRAVGDSDLGCGPSVPGDCIWRHLVPMGAVLIFQHCRLDVLAHGSLLFWRTTTHLDLHLYLEKSGRYAVLPQSHL